MRCLIANPVSTPVLSLEQVATIAIWAKALFERNPLDEVVYVVDLDDVMKLTVRETRTAGQAEWRLDTHRLTIAELQRALKEKSCVPENKVAEHKEAENKKGGEETVQLKAGDVLRTDRRRVKYYRTLKADEVLFVESGQHTDCTGNAEFPFTVKGEKVLVLEKNRPETPAEALRRHTPEEALPRNTREEALQRIALELAEWHQAQWEESRKESPASQQRTT
ncbi:hypothetical protein GNI_058440 [Gregarina niphandrodes]|uniref:Uncharacterized protein n=1 Tax=Gregarina niphandrodes TaxID=110365 RepID=A0A023B8N0_GRENI|nr:hypothetical protein GNI_058440 [Gregarina niphandrodes]EZG69373.1 hypothetical protein GNI_058440 [Gregarina niphandrodes]|eukprot:XP_011134443.1 hypothetical protein GNI_058440 [Gregarina niphandrodes]